MTNLNTESTDINKKKEESRKSTVEKLILRSKQFKDLISNLVILLLIFLFAYFVCKDFNKTLVYIKPFNSPHEWSKIGLDGENLASILKFELNKIRHIETSFPNSKDELIYIEESRRNDYEIKDPIGGFSISKLKIFLQDILFNNQKVVYGFVTTHSKKKNRLLIKLDDMVLSSYTFDKAENIDSILQNVAEDFIRIHEDKYLLGMHYLLAKKDTLNCFKIIQEIINDDDISNNYKAYHLRGILYLKHRKNALNLAKKDFQRVIKSTSQSHPAFNNLGRIYEQQLKFDSAATMYQKAIQVNKSYSGAYFNLGNIYMSKFKLDSLKHEFRDSAEFNYRKAIEYNRNFMPGYLVLGNCLRNKNESEAIKMYEKAVQIDPFNPISYLQYGLYYHSKKKKKNAFYYLNKAEEFYHLDSIKYANFKSPILKKKKEILNAYPQE